MCVRRACWHVAISQLPIWANVDDFMNAAQQVTVQWLPSLAATDDLKAAAALIFERQTGRAPEQFYFNPQLSIWGWFGGGASLLFVIPHDD